MCICKHLQYSGSVRVRWGLLEHGTSIGMSQMEGENLTTNILCVVERKDPSLAFNAFYSDTCRGNQGICEAFPAKRIVKNPVDSSYGSMDSIDADLQTKSMPLSITILRIHASNINGCHLPWCRSITLGIDFKQESEFGKSCPDKQVLRYRTAFFCITNLLLCDLPLQLLTDCLHVPPN